MLGAALAGSPAGGAPGEVEPGFGGPGFVLTRVSADGVPDAAFGSGRTLVELPVVLGGRLTAVAVTAAGDLLAAGLDFIDETVDISPSDILLVKVRSGGPDDAGHRVTRRDGGVSAFGSAGARR